MAFLDQMAHPSPLVYSFPNMQMMRERAAEEWEERNCLAEVDVGGQLGHCTCVCQVSECLVLGQACMAGQIQCQPKQQETICSGLAESYPQADGLGGGRLDCCTSIKMRTDWARRSAALMYLNKLQGDEESICD